MPDISKLEGSPWIGTDTRWSNPRISPSSSTIRPPTRPTENALCSHIWARTRALTPNQTLRIRDAIPHGDTERTDALDIVEWGHFASAIQACRPSIISISQDLGIMMASFSGCPEDQCRISHLHDPAQVTARDKLMRHFGTRAISRVPSPFTQLNLAEDMSVVVDWDDPTLQSYNQHIRGLRLEDDRSGNTMMDWNRPGRNVNGERMTLARVYTELCGQVHQTVFVDPPTRVSDSLTEQPENRRGRLRLVNSGPA